MTSGSTTRFLVPVAEPTALAGQTSMKVPGQDLFRCYVSNVHVIPAEIDVSRFNAALSKTVARYPHMAGRQVREGDDWRIDLTDSPTPVIVSRISPSTSELSPTYPFPSNFTIQPADLIRRFLNTEDCTKILVGGDGTDPLLAFKLTIWENGTAIGSTWCHTCGDAFSMWDVTRCLSAYYINLEAPESDLPRAPYLYRHFFRSPFSRSPQCADLTENFLPRMPYLANDYDMEPLWQKHAELNAKCDQVQLRISGESIEKLYQAAREEGSIHGENHKVTRHDVLMAYLIKVLHQCQDDLIHTLAIVLNGRGSHSNPSTVTAFNNPSAQGNVIVVMYSDHLPPSSGHSLYGLAKFIRNTVSQARDHAFMEKWMSWASYLTAKTTNAGKEGRYWYYGPEEGELWFNSNYRTDWNDANFGYPGKARFFTSGSAWNYFRIFPANPRTDISTTSNSAGDADICLQLNKAFSKKFESIVTQEYPDTLVE